MATTSNYLQWPTHRRKAIERRRRKAHMQKRGQHGKTPGNQTTNTAGMALALREKPLAMVYETQTETNG